MTKVGILTYHNNENKGAILQAYCLQEAVKSIFSVKVEIIEYRTVSKEKNRRNSIFITKHPRNIISSMADKNISEEFFQSNLSLSDNSITTDDHEKAVNWIKQQDYDIIITGSDEIWKVNNDTGIYNWFFPSRPFPNLYSLDPRITAVKVAYAASANETNPRDLSKETLDTLKKHISSYDYISVRDKHTQDLVADIGIKSVYKVPDPTILEDIPTRNTTPILERNGVDTSQPILGFHSQGGDQVFESICEQYRHRGFQVVTPTSASYADVELAGKLNPFEYYSVYDEFDMMVTSSLHSTIFSIKQNTPFVTVDYNPVYKDLESKTHSLLADFDLLDRHINALNRNKSQIHYIVKKSETINNKEKIMDKVSQLREEGINFLEMVNEEYEKNK